MSENHICAPEGCHYCEVVKAGESAEYISEVMRTFSGDNSDEE